MLCKNYACEVQLYTQVCFLDITRRMIQIRVEFFFTLLVPTSFRGTAISSTRKLLQRGGGCVVVCAVVLVVQSNLLWRIRIMCVNIF